MHYRVERQQGGAWRPTVGAIRAENARQAVALASGAAGIYRAIPYEAMGVEEHFTVPEWGPPEPIESSGRRLTVRGHAAAGGG